MIKLTSVNNSGGYIENGQLMSQKKLKRVQVLELLKENKISQQEASKRLVINTRQVRQPDQTLSDGGLGGVGQQEAR